MTTKELIAKLTKLIEEQPELADAPVQTEGCDCVGPAESIEEYPETISWSSRETITTVLVTRHHKEY